MSAVRSRILHALFAPAMRMMNGLSYARKFLVLALLSLIAVVVVLAGLYQNLSQTIQRSELELIGLTQIEASLRTVQALQKHRGLSMAVLSGLNPMQDRQQSVAQDVDTALADLRLRLPADDEMLAAFEDIQSVWLQVKRDGNALGATENFAFHCSLIARTLRLQDRFRDHAMLIVDGDRGAYYLIELLSRHLPDSLESIAQLRGRGVGLLVVKTLTSDDQVAVRVLKEMIGQRVAKTLEVIDDARRYNPDLYEMLRLTQQGIEASGQRIGQVIDYDVSKRAFADDPEQFFADVTETIDALYLHIFDSFLPATAFRIQARIEHARHVLWLSVAIPALLFLLLIYLAIGSHLALSRNMAALARAAKAFSEGDMSQRLTLSADDEIGRISASFNVMADSFAGLLNSHQQYEKRLQSIIDSALDAVVQMDAVGRIRGWNRQAERIFGWQTADVLGQPLHDVLAPERFRAAHEQGLHRFLETGVGDFLNRRVEINALHRDGYEFPIEVAITPNQLNETTEFTAFIRDISDQKRALQAIKNSELRYRMLFESSRDAIVTLSAGKGILSANTAAIQLFAASDESTLIAKMMDYLSPERQASGELSADAAKNRIGQALSQGFSEYEWVFKRLNGDIFIAEVRLVRFEVGDEVLLQASLRDITERKHARQLLMTSEARVRAILRTMKDAVLQIDAHGRILLVNESTSELFGYEEDELIGKNVNILMPEPHASLHNDYLRRHAEQRHRVIIGRRVELEGKHRNGDLIPIELSVNEALDDFGRTYIGVIRDIRQRRMVEQEREMARQQAEQLAHVKSEFLANMSHEIRTPLNAIIGLAKMGLRDHGDSGAASHFDRIRLAGKHLLNIVNDILDFSKLEAGKMTIDPHLFQLSALIDDAVALVEMRAREKQLRLKIEKQAGMPEWVIGDSLRLRQILVNLLSNAIKFTELGYVAVKVERSGNQTSFTVADSGIGMSPTQMSRLFNAFEQADGSTTRKFGGSGLGLAISRNLARLMGGDIQVSSVYGVGSEFMLTLPLATAQPPANPVPVLPSDQPRLTGIRALAAEDVELNRMILEDLLVHEGAQVVFASNGRQALEKLDAMAYTGIDVVLMDIQMPVLDGYQAARIIRQRAPHLPIIGLTAHAMPEEKQRCLDAGMCDHVTKPIEIDELVAAIRQSLDKRAVPSESRVEPDAPPAPADVMADATKTGLVDWPGVLARFGGRQAFVMKLVDNALSPVQTGNIEKLRNAAQAGDHAAVKFIAHSLKGLAGVFLHDGLLATAQDTEQAAKHQDEHYPALALTLADQLQNLIDELTRYRETHKHDEPQST